MQDEQVLQELERLVGQDDQHSRGQLAKILLDLKQRAAAYQISNQHWKGISLVGRARRIVVPQTELDRVMALLLGGEAELALRWSDAMRIRPPATLLVRIESSLHDAIKVDPSLPDPYWDLAVIQSRYRADYASAKGNLAAARALGYQHPMIPRLTALIEAGLALPVATVNDDLRLRQLILILAIQSTGSLAGMLLQDEESDSMSLLLVEPTSEGLTGANRNLTMQGTFGDYLREARSIADAKTLTEAQFLQILNDSQVITGDAGEYIADLLRQVAEHAKLQKFLAQATAHHLRIIRDLAFSLFDRRNFDPVFIQRSRRAAERGLGIAEVSKAAIDGDIYADLLIARGQALYYQDKPYLAEAIRCYHKALGYKRQTGNDADVKKLEEILWKQIDHRRGRAVWSLIMGGVGEALDILEACVEVVDDLDNPPHAMGVKVEFASALRQVGRFEEAEEILNTILAGTPPKRVLRDAEYELASVFSETDRPEAAAAIQRELLDHGGMENTTTTSTLWSNYANSLRLSGDFSGARSALEKAWETLPSGQRKKAGTEIPLQAARLQMLFAQLEAELGNIPEAMQHMEIAESINTLPLGVDGLHFQSTKARCLLESDRLDEAAECLDSAIHNLGFLLGHGPGLKSWESLLAQWSRLDVSAVRAHLNSNSPNGVEHAFLRAESAKGRLYAWFERWFAPQGAQQALALQRQIDALAGARHWLSGKPRRRVVSLFGSDEGLGIFGVNQEGQVTGAWLDDFNYGVFCRDVYDSWERLVEQTLASDDSNAFALASIMTNYLLDLAGGWLWRANPEIAEGGSDLVILPHRLFRNLPLAHARLPTGRRLSDLFDRIFVLPSLGDLEHKPVITPDPNGPILISALADADNFRPLPFARCEALLAATDYLTVGDQVTVDVLRSAFARDSVLLLSLHGDFNTVNPFQSKIFATDGEIRLHQLLLGQTPIQSRIVIMGVCEAGRSRRSVSDEPMGFPALLLQGGVATVVAPLWPIDDFASFLFISKLVEEIHRGNDVCRAVQACARWLSEATAQSALSQLDELLGRVAASGEEGMAAVAALAPRLDAQRAWLETLGPKDKPFGSPLDWAAFQTYGCLLA